MLLKRKAMSRKGPLIPRTEVAREHRGRRLGAVVGRINRARKLAKEVASRNRSQKGEGDQGKAEVGSDGCLEAADLDMQVPGAASEMLLIEGEQGEGGLNAGGGEDGVQAEGQDEETEDGPTEREEDSEGGEGGEEAEEGEDAETEEGREEDEEGEQELLTGSDGECAETELKLDDKNRDASDLQEKPCSLGEAEGEDEDERTEPEAGAEASQEPEEERRRIKGPLPKPRVLGAKKKSHKTGVCYLSRIPPHMKPLKLRHLLSAYAAIGRVYLAPEDATVRLKRKQVGGNRGKNFTEGWVEFERKRDAKRVAAMLNGEPMGGGHRSAYKYDLWTIKYLSGFKWDHLTEEIAYRNAVREQKLAAELRAAAKERDYYLHQVNRSKALNAMEEKRKKRQLAGTQKPSEEASGVQESKKLRRAFIQRDAVSNPGDRATPNLSSDVLSKVFG